MKIRKIDEMNEEYIPFFKDNGNADGNVDVVTAFFDHSSHRNVEISWNIKMKNFYLDWCEATATVKKSDCTNWHVGDSVDVEIGYGDDFDAVESMLMDELEKRGKNKSKLDESAMINKKELYPKYAIRRVDVYTTSIERGIGETDDKKSTTMNVQIFGNSIMDVAGKFLNEALNGYEIRLDSIYFNSHGNYLMYSVTGKRDDGSFAFVEPSKKDLDDDYLTAYVYCMFVEKVEPVSKQDLNFENIRVL